VLLARREKIVRQASRLDRAQLEKLEADDEAAWNDHDPQRLGQLCAEDVSFTSVALDEPIHGRAALSALAQMYMRAMPDFHIENRAVAFTEDCVVIEWRATGTHR
jgi:uncharacterized protein (TIGR02246 family)